MAGESKVLKHYKMDHREKIFFLVILGISIFLCSVVSISVGSVDIPIREVFSILIGRGSKSSWNTIIWNIRMPRILGALVAGMGLAVAGGAMQTILRNPIGSPFTLGISHSSAFGAAFAIIVLGAGSTHSSYTDAVLIGDQNIVSLSAFLFSLLSTGVIVFLAKYKGAKTETMILAGVAMASLFTAGTRALQYFADEVELASVIFWTFGDLGRISWNDLWFMSMVAVPVSVYLLKNSWNYSAMNSGDETAKSLGVNVERLRITGLLAASLLTAHIVSFVGIIGFVGLIVPHMVRKLIGGDQRFMMAGSILMGALLLLISDTIARTVMSPVVLPVGILTSFLGAPLFLFLVIKGRDYW